MGTERIRSGKEGQRERGWEETQEGVRAWEGNKEVSGGGDGRNMIKIHSSSV